MFFVITTSKRYFMADSTDIDTAIDTLLDNPKSVSSPSGSVTNISIPEAIAADKHIARKAITANPFFGIKRAIARGPRHYGT